MYVMRPQRPIITVSALWVVVYRLDEARRAAADAREKLERQNQQLSDLEAEVGLLRRRVEQLETDRDKDKKLIAQLQESLNRARAVCLFILAFSRRLHTHQIVMYRAID